jgi:hypothetical protein
MEKDSREQLAFSVEEFCKTHSISRPGLYQLWARGEGPDVMRAGRRVLISTESAAAWRQRLTQKGGGHG